MANCIIIILLTIFLILMTTLFNICQLLYILFLPFNNFKRPIYYINSFLANLVWIILDYIFKDLNNTDIEYAGEALHLPKNESALIISNHCAATDFYLVQSIARRSHMLPFCRYFIKNSVKYIPIFGWGIWMMGHILLKRNWSSDGQKIRDIFKFYTNFKLPAWLISFPEGSRFTKSKMDKSQEFCKNSGYDLFENVLYPRTKGFIATLESNKNSHFNAIYDMTIAVCHKKKGFGRVPSIIQVHTGKLDQFKFHIFVRRYEMNEIPLKEEEISQWLVDRFKEKDIYLRKLKKRWMKEMKLKDLHHSSHDRHYYENERSLDNGDDDDDYETERKTFKSSHSPSSSMKKDSGNSSNNFHQHGMNMMTDISSEKSMDGKNSKKIIIADDPYSHLLDIDGNDNYLNSHSHPYPHSHSHSHSQFHDSSKNFHPNNLPCIQNKG